jgi:two-component system, cell cycle sensor histidine kinase and response regulator CckA
MRICYTAVDCQTPCTVSSSQPKYDDIEMPEKPFITLIPPVCSLLTGLFLATLSLIRSRKKSENILFSLVCIWVSMLAPVFILQHFITEEQALLRIDRSIHFFYVYLPPIFIAFFHRTVGLKRPRLTAGAFFVSFVISLSTQSNAYIAGLNRYGWGSIAKGGPVFTFFGIYCSLVLIYTIACLAYDQKQEKNPISLRKKQYILIGFIVTGALTLGNMPSINGLDFYPTGNFMFLPLAVMAYGVLKYRLMDIPGFFFNLLFWITLCAAIFLPNLLLFHLAFSFLTDSDPMVLFSLLMLWFLANLFYVKRMQAALEPVFHRIQASLRKTEARFLENILLLRSRNDLIREFAKVLKHALLIEELSFYEKSGEDNRYIGPSGRRWELTSLSKAWLLARHTPIQRSLLETNPHHPSTQESLLEGFRGTGGRYLLPLVANDDLLGFFILGPRADGREIRPDEARFLENTLPVLSTALSNAMLYQSVSDLKDALEERTAALTREMAERKQAEEERRKSDEKYRIVTEKVSDVIWVVNIETGMFEYISPSVQRLIGYSAEEMLTIPLGDILTPESLKKSMHVLAEELKNEPTEDPDRSRTVELDHVPRNGPTFPAEVTTSFLRDSSGRITGILGVTRDIRERKKLETQLRTARKMEAIGTLAGGVAHDLNNILSGVTSYPELLLMELPEDSPLKQPIQTIKRSGEKAAAIVQDLLTLSRRIDTVKEVVNLNDIVTEYLNSPEFEMLKSYHLDIDITCDLDPLLFHIRGSRVHLQKIVMNIVSNAAEAMPHGGHIRVRTKNGGAVPDTPATDAMSDGRNVLLEVSDTGLGIAPEDLERIFEPFYTTKKMGRSGTGLGMAVVWGTVQDHDGTIDVDSHPGAGTTFTIHLPAVDGTPPADKPDITLDELRGDGETILVVDDIPEQREIASRILEKLGYRVRTAASGEEAIDLLRNGPVDLILLDMIMDPGMDGLTTYQRILDLHPRQKAIPISGFSETHQVREVLRLGAGGYIRKPYTLESIGRAVKMELNRT